jgi:DNA-directed RNA polymerase subunit RPC12/RpoP
MHRCADCFRELTERNYGGSLNSAAYVEYVCRRCMKGRQRVDRDNGRVIMAGALAAVGLLGLMWLATFLPAIIKR